MLVGPTADLTDVEAAANAALSDDNPVLANLKQAGSTLGVIDKK